MSCLFCSHRSPSEINTKGATSEGRNVKKVECTLINSALSLSLCNLLGFGEADLHLDYFKQCYFCISCRDKLVRLSVFQQQLKRLENDIQDIKNDFQLSLAQTYRSQQEIGSTSGRICEQNYGSNFTNCVRKALVQELQLIQIQNEKPTECREKHTVDNRAGGEEDGELSASCEIEMDVDDNEDSCKNSEEETYDDRSMNASDRRSLPRRVKIFSKSTKSLRSGSKSNSSHQGNTTSCKGSRNDGSSCMSPPAASGKVCAKTKNMYYPGEVDKPKHDCEFCPAKFLYKHSLNVHIDFKHGGRRSRNCPFCPFVSSTNQVFVTHMMTHTKPVGGVASESTNNDTHAQLSHVSKENYASAPTTTKEKPNIVSLSLPGTTVVHQAGSKFLCPICGLKYSHKKDLKRHWLKKHKSQISLFHDMFAKKERDESAKTSRSREVRRKQNHIHSQTNINTRSSVASNVHNLKCSAPDQDTVETVNLEDDDVSLLSLPSEPTKEVPSLDVDDKLLTVEATVEAENNNKVLLGVQVATDDSKPADKIEVKHCNGTQDFEATEGGKGDALSIKDSDEPKTIKRDEHPSGKLEKGENAEKKVEFLVGAQVGEEGDVPDACCEFVI